MLIDTHCHLNFPCFSSSLVSVLDEANKVGVDTFIIPSTHAESWQAIEALSLKFNAIYYALGIHPSFLADFKSQHLSLLSTRLDELPSKCVAIGEIGLDKFSDSDDKLQELVFIEQLKIATNMRLPVILHIVKKQQRVIEILKQLNFKQGGVYHAFSGSIEVANEFIKLGFKLGIGSVITYPTATKTREAIRRIPISAIVLETDAPDMPVYVQHQHQHQKQINTPAHLLLIFNELALLRTEGKDVLAREINSNSRLLFSELLPHTNSQQKRKY